MKQISNMANMVLSREEKLRQLIEDVWAETAISGNAVRSMAKVRDMCKSTIDMFAEEDEAKVSKHGKK